MDDINKMSEKDSILNELKNLDPPMTDDRFNLKRYGNLNNPNFYRKFAENIQKNAAVESNRELDGEELKPISN